MDYELKSVECLYSYGIGHEYGFEQELYASRGLHGRLFDPTVDHPERISEGLCFKKVGLATGQGSILDHMSDHGDSGKKALLKIDVEGSEWLWLQQTTENELLSFDQICIEFHHIGKVEKHAEYASLLEKLTTHFILYHIHGNNFGPIVITDELIIPDTVECSFIRKGLCDVTLNTSETFPVAGLDYPSDQSEFAPLDWRFNYWPYISNQDIYTENKAIADTFELLSNFKKLKTLQFNINNLKASGSWRATAPVRAILSHFRKT